MTKSKLVMSSAFALVLAVAYVLVTMFIAALVGSSVRDMAPPPPVNKNVSVPKVSEPPTMLDNPKSPQLERSYVGKDAFDEQYECQLDVKSKAGAQSKEQMTGVFYVWLRSGSDAKYAKYMISRDAEFNSSVFKPEETKWLRVEGGNSNHLCLDVASLGEKSGKFGCMLAFNREFPEMTEYDTQRPISQGVCRRIPKK